MIDEDHEDPIAEDERGFREDGSPTLASVSDAIQTWAITNDIQRHRDIGESHKGMTTAEAALAFALPLERVTAAIEWHPWMFLTGEGPTAIIEHEGE